MQPSQLNVKKIQLTKIAVEAISSSWTEQGIDKCDVEIFRHQEITHAWIVTLTVSFGANRQTARYVGVISLIGEFVTAEGVSEAVAENLVNVNGPAILYSTAREIILNFTSRTPNGAWMLPAVTFIDRKKVPPVAPAVPEPKPEVVGE